jgi:hypothetical protein
MLGPSLLRPSIKPTACAPDQEHGEHNQEHNQELDIQEHNDIQEHINHIQERNQEDSSRQRNKSEAVVQGAY